MKKKNLAASSLHLLLFPSISDPFFVHVHMVQNVKKGEKGVKVHIKIYFTECGELFLSGGEPIP